MKWSKIPLCQCMRVIVLFDCNVVFDCIYKKILIDNYIEMLHH